MYFFTTFPGLASFSINLKEPIKSMPGVFRYSLDNIEYLVEKAINKKIPMIALFPHTPNSKKDSKGSEALNKNNLVCKALRLIKKNYKEILHVTWQGGSNAVSKTDWSQLHNIGIEITKT